YTPFERPEINDIKHAFIERIGAECQAADIPFFLEFVGYDPDGGDEKGLEYAQRKPEIVRASVAEFNQNLALAAASGVKFNGVLCGRATWKDGIGVYAQQGLKGFETWLQTQ